MPPWPVLLLLVHLAGWGGPWLDLPALALVALGWGGALGLAVPLAWGTGLLLDALSLGPLGPQALAWAAAVGALSVQQREARRAELPTLALACILVSLWLGVATAAAGGFRAFSGGEWAIRALATGAIAPVLLAPVRRAWRRGRRTT